MDQIPSAPFFIPTFKGARLRKAANETTVNATTAYAIPFDTEIFDEGGWHDGTNPSRLTVPAGVSWIAIDGNVGLANATAAEQITVDIRKNGAAFNGMPRMQLVPGTTTPVFQVASIALPAVPGDYFELFVTVAADTSITIVAVTTF